MIIVVSFSLFRRQYTTITYDLSTANRKIVLFEMKSKGTQEPVAV
jgi:hypothetical protein